MAEGFARAYGSDVMTPQSAGLAPAQIIAPLTYKVMLEKNITLAQNYPKSLDGSIIHNSDALVNMSGQQLMPYGPLRVEEWTVRDPIGEGVEVFREVANQIEHLVMRMILKMRAEQ